MAEERQRLAASPQAVSEVVAGYAVPVGLEPAELATWFHVATILLNLDETITKG